MANIMIFKKFLYGFVVMGALPPFAQMLQISLGWLPTSVSIILMAITILPEAACVYSKSFWAWVKSGIEDSDGHFNRTDLGEFLGYYGTFCVFRTFIFGYLMAMIGGWSPEPEILYAPLVAAGGGGVLNLIKSKKV